MRKFFERWYGDQCPGWTWPATFGAISITFLSLVFAHGISRQWECEAKGGTVMKRDGCYLVTKTKID